MQFAAPSLIAADGVPALVSGVADPVSKERLDQIVGGIEKWLERERGLQSPLDLMFLARVLIDQGEWINRFLDGSNELAGSEFDIPAHLLSEAGPIGIRFREAYEWAGRHRVPLARWLLRSLLLRAEERQAEGWIPQRTVDYLVVVQAVAFALARMSLQNQRVTGLVRRDEALVRLRREPNAGRRRAIGALWDRVETYYAETPARLIGAFDLEFFVEMLALKLPDVEGVLRGTVDPEVAAQYWAPPAPRKIVDPECDIDPLGYDLRRDQAWNFSLAQGDATRAAIVHALLLAATMLQGRHGGAWVLPVVIRFPMDELFFAMAMDDALKPGRPGRMLLEGITA